MNHECEEIPSDFYVGRLNSTKEWFVSDISSAVVGIKRCPFCGKELKGKKQCPNKK